MNEIKDSLDQKQGINVLEGGSKRPHSDKSDGDIHIHSASIAKVPHERIRVGRGENQANDFALLINGS